MQTLTIAENSNADLKEKLKAEEQQRKSADAVLKGAETQAESQRKLASEVKGQLVTAKEQIAALRQQLEEANRLKGLAEKAKVQRRTSSKPRRRGTRLSNTATTLA